MSTSSDIEIYKGNLTGFAYAFSERPAKDVGGLLELKGVAGHQGYRIHKWGADNLQPQRREELVYESGVASPLINTKANIILGQGLMFYKERFEDGERIVEQVAPPADIAEWLVESDFHDQYLDPASVDIYKQGNIMPEFILNRDQTVRTVTAIEAKHVRAEEKDSKGRIRRYFASNDWSGQTRDPKNYRIVTIPAYDRGRVLYKFIYHVADRTYNDGYYGYPPYWSSRKFMEISKATAEFHQHNINNGYVIRYHIEYPKGYFLDQDKYNQCAGDPDKVKAVRDLERQNKQAFMDTVDSILSGAQNAGKSLYTSYELNMQLGKDFPGIKVTPIKTDMKDEALLKLLDHSNKQIQMSMNIHSTIANLDTSGKLSSGSDIRNAYLFYLITQTYRVRKLLLRPMDLVFKINGWNKKYPDLKYGFNDTAITKLDESKTGTQPMTENQ